MPRGARTTRAMTHGLDSPTGPAKMRRGEREVLIRRSLQAGLVTGGLMALLVFAIYALWDQLHLVWPIAFVPVFLTGWFAVRRTHPASGGQAAFAGALAGLSAGIVSALAVAGVTLLSLPGSGHAYPYWNLFLTLTTPPFSVPTDVIFIDLSFKFPFPWFFAKTLQDGTQVSRLPSTYVLFAPAGVVLAATQAWLYDLVARRAGLGTRAVAGIARVRARFESKLLTGFAILTALIFATGWLGFSSVEEMHQRLHQVRTGQHWSDHTVQIESNVRAIDDALVKVAAAPDAAGVERVAKLSRDVTTQLAHVKSLPPPAHPTLRTGPEPQRAEAERRLPRVLEVDVRFNGWSAGVSRALDLYRGGNSADASAALAALAPQRKALDEALRALAGELNADLPRLAADADNASHEQLLLVMVLVLTATAVAFPLGYLFAQVVVRPVTKVGSGLERIGLGEFDHRVEVENRDELGELAARVNQMGTELNRLYGELKGLNENLQQKVQEAIHEIERSRMLRRYLPHQVADSIIASGDESILATHRREITVLFCDLRGFTAFSETAEPEVVMRVLAQYHQAVGELIQRFQGTLEHFAGDGVMVYFNDPIPVPDHPQRAARMSVAMRERVGELAKQWRKLGFELDFGVGVAIGYATLGTIGFEGRHDYGAIGSVTNLASRLSDEAKGGQILVSQRVQALVEDIAETEPVGSLPVKGFLKPVSAFNVVALKEARAAV